MIYGVGTDIIEIQRVVKACEKESFLRKNFSEKEIEYFRTVDFRKETLAGAFSAKESLAKALGTGFSGFSAIDVEVLHNEKGAPYIVLSNRVTSKFQDNLKINISISHCKDYAISYAVLEVEDI